MQRQQMFGVVSAKRSASIGLQEFNKLVQNDLLTILKPRKQQHNLGKCRNLFSHSVSRNRSFWLDICEVGIRWELKVQNELRTE